MRAVADYTVLNLKEVEDKAPAFGYAPGLEARFARQALGLEQSGISYFGVAPGFRVPFGHRHSEQEEIYLVVSGSASVKLDDDIVELRAWDAVRIPAGTMRGLEGGPEGAEVIAFGAPNTENRDIEMEGEFGLLHVHIENIPSENPKTGRLTALSMIRAIRDAVDYVRVGT